MSSTNDFVIKNGVLKKYHGPGGDVVVPEGVTIIGKYAFSDVNSIKTITISETVTEINEGAFADCDHLTDLILPKNLKSFDTSDLPRSLERFSCFHTLKSFSIVDGVLFSKSGKELFAYPRAKQGEEYIIPDGVTKIGKFAFQNNPFLKKIVMPETLTSIFESSLAYCEADLVRLPRSLQRLSRKAFKIPSEYGDLHKREPYVICYRPEFPEMLWHPIYIGSIDDLPPKAKNGAITGFIYAEKNGIEEIKPYRASYLAHIKNNFSTYQKKALTEADTLDLIVNERLFPPKSIDELIKLTQKKKRPDLTAILLEALNGSNSADSMRLSDKDPEIKRMTKMMERREEIKNQRGIKGLVFVASGDLPELGVSHHEYTGAVDWSPLKKYIEERGGFLRSAVSAKTDYLICNDPNSNTKKSIAAHELKIPVITEEEFLKMASEE